MNKRKNTRTQSYRKRSIKKQSPRYLWLFAGVLIGVLIPSYFLLKSPSSTTHSAAAINSIQEEVTNPPLPITKATAKKIRSKRDSSSHQANYEFYNLLSSEEDQTSKSNLADNQNKKLFNLQIASFKTFDKADELKAELSFLGIEKLAIVKSSQGYSLVSGPYPTRENAGKTLKVLKDNDWPGKIVEIAPPL